MRVTLNLRSTTPMLQHNAQLASPLNGYARKIKAISAKRTKTDEDRWELARLEWEAGLYYDENTGPTLPNMNVYAALREAGKMSKSRRKIERGVMITQMSVPLEYDGPRDLASLWGNGESAFVDLRSVGVQTNRVDRCRPIFPAWSAQTEWLIDPAVIDPEEVISIADTAGRLIGVGDFRLIYGRFSVDSQTQPE